MRPLPPGRPYNRQSLTTLRAALQHVRFIGGGSGSGKSTVANRLALEHGLRLYDAERFSTFVARTTPADAPLLHAFVAMDMDERWLTRTPKTMRDTFHGFHGETLPLVIEDLLALPKEPPILAEGFSLLPRFLAPLLTHEHQAVWLLPTPEFRRFAFDARGSTYDIPRRTSDPVRALENHLARERLFTEDLTRETADLGVRVIHVDLPMDIDELTRRVAANLNLALP
jgi:2-phosphoglycerate kinase